MTDVSPTASPDAETPREVDRIRDILFGSQMRDYQQRFQVVQRDLERLRQELDKLSEQLANQDAEHNQKLQNLRREAKQGADELRSELRQTAHDLADAKVDRVTLGEMFIEIGNQLKAGSSTAGLLSGLDKLTSDGENGSRKPTG